MPLGKQMNIWVAVEHICQGNFDSLIKLRQLSAQLPGTAHPIRQQAHQNCC